MCVCDLALPEGLQEAMRMRRREFIKLLTGATIAGPRAAIAQAPPKVFHLGTLVPGAPLDEKNPLTAILLKALEQHGYTLGKNLTLEARGAGGEVGKLPEIVRGMKANQVDVIRSRRLSSNTCLQGCECNYGCRLRRWRSGRHPPYRRVSTAG